MSTFTEETPSNIDQLKQDANCKTDYNIRLLAVEELGKYKCQKSKDILWRRMISDKVHAVQELAFLKLQAFGEDVSLPRKKKGNALVKDLMKKLSRVRDAASDKPSSGRLFETLSHPCISAVPAVALAKAGCRSVVKSSKDWKLSKLVPL